MQSSCAPQSVFYRLIPVFIQNLMWYDRLSALMSVRKMELSVRCVSSSCEVRSVICFLTAEGIPTPAIHTHLKNVYSDSVMPLRTVHLWVPKFKEEKWENVQDKEHSGRPNEASTEEKRCCTPHSQRDRRYTICEITEQLADIHCITLSHMTVQCILADEDFTKICMQWVPKLLIDANKQAQLDAANEFLH